MKTCKGNHTCTVEIWFVNRSQRWCKLLTKVLYVQLGSDLQINLKDDAQESLICTVERWCKLLTKVLYVQLRSDLKINQESFSRKSCMHGWDLICKSNLKDDESFLRKSYMHGWDLSFYSKWWQEQIPYKSRSIGQKKSSTSHIFNTHQSSPLLKF